MTIASPPAAGAITVRRATAGDYPAFTRLFPELGVDDPVPDLARFTDHMVPWTWVAERDGAVVAYCFCQELGQTAYVRHVVVAPAAQGQGVGAALTRRVAAHLRGQGVTRWCLNVKPDNRPAVRLYRLLGLRPRYASTALRLPWAAVENLPEDATPATVRLLDPTEDADVEREFEMPAGQLGPTRIPGRVLVKLVDDRNGFLLGFAVFDPAFPGAFPFRLKRPTLARRLLDGLRPHALPEHTFLYVVTEADSALTTLLRGVGAEVRHEIVHMTGDLPDPWEAARRQ